MQLTDGRSIGSKRNWVPSGEMLWWEIRGGGQNYWAAGAWWGSRGWVEPVLVWHAHGGLWWLVTQHPGWIWCCFSWSHLALPPWWLEKSRLRGSIVMTIKRRWNLQSSRMRWKFLWWLIAHKCWVELLPRPLILMKLDIVPNLWRHADGVVSKVRVTLRLVGHPHRTLQRHLKKLTRRPLGYSGWACFKVVGCCTSCCISNRPLCSDWILLFNSSSFRKWPLKNIAIFLSQFDLHRLSLRLKGFINSEWFILIQGLLHILFFNYRRSFPVVLSRVRFLVRPVECQLHWFGSNGQPRVFRSLLGVAVLPSYIAHRHLHMTLTEWRSILIVHIVLSDRDYLVGLFIECDLNQCMQDSGDIDALEVTGIVSGISWVFDPFDFKDGIIFWNLDQINDKWQEGLPINQSNRKLNHRLTASQNFENLTAPLLLLWHAPKLLLVSDLKTDAFLWKVSKWKRILMSLILHVW